MVFVDDAGSASGALLTEDSLAASCGRVSAAFSECFTRGKKRRWISLGWDFLGFWVVNRVGSFVLNPFLWLSVAVEHTRAAQDGVRGRG